MMCCAFLKVVQAFRDVFIEFFDVFSVQPDRKFWIRLAHVGGALWPGEARARGARELRRLEARGHRLVARRRGVHGLTNDLLTAPC